jgi:two-component system, chemotaxis family, sensor kinase CheA
MGNRSDDLRDRLMATFRPEAEEHLGVIGNQLIALERGTPSETAAEAVEAVFRATHTLKGAARSVGLEEVERLCQGVESALSRIKAGSARLTPDQIGWMQDVMHSVARLVAGQAPAAPSADLLRMLDRELTPPARPSVSAIDAAVPPPSSPATVRIGVSSLEALQARAEDLLAIKLAIDERVRDAQALVEVLHDRSGLGPKPDRGVEAQARRLLFRLIRDRGVAASSVNALQDELRPLRMTSPSAVLDLLSSMIAQMARRQGKEIDFEAEGADLQMDRKVLETVKDPLLHLVRNAVDHGIEKPEIRAQAGKPRRGRITVGFTAREGSLIEVQVADDGAGIDVAALRSAAVRARMMVESEAAALPEVAALDLAFASGVSTSPVITDLSGHGLGMAIVRDRIGQLGGRVLLETEPGRKTTVRMLLPASVVTFRGLLVGIGAESFLLPIEAVERAFRVTAKDILDLDGREVVRWNGRVLPARALHLVLGRDRAGNGSSSLTCLIVSAAGSCAALLVDEVIGEREVLVKELQRPLVRVRHVRGAGLLGNGALALILRPADLIRAAQEVSVAPEVARVSADGAPAAILVADDSITTRTMERNLLEAAGYVVKTAADGMEAWALLKSERFDMVLSDVDMPRLNGFELTARIRSDAELKALPVVLVTALESRADKERGIDVGANAYVIKSGFDQSKLLEIIQRLL